MFSDEPEEEQAKAALEEIEPSTLFGKTAWDAWRPANDGLVVWNRIPPVGVAYQIHRYSLLDAIATGFAFCQTRCINEWLIVGQSALAVLRFLEQFKMEPGIPCTNCPLVYIGKIREITVFLSPDQYPREFCVGIPGRACRGVIDDGTAFVEREPDDGPAD